MPAMICIREKKNEIQLFLENIHIWKSSLTMQMNTMPSWKSHTCKKNQRWSKKLGRSYVISRNLFDLAKRRKNSKYSNDAYLLFFSYWVFCNDTYVITKVAMHIEQTYHFPIIKLPENKKRECAKEMYFTCSTERKIQHLETSFSWSINNWGVALMKNILL